MKKTELSNIEITHVSYVKKGANKKQFFLLKSEDEPVFKKEVRIFVNKSNDEEKLVYGIVYEPDEIDTQGEFAKAKDIEIAAHNFLEKSRNIDLQHNFKTDYGTVVESYIAPDNITVNEEKIKKGSWVLVTKATDEVWEDIKNGIITGYSMAGLAQKREINDNIKKTSDISETDEYRSFFNVIKDFFSKNKKESEAIKKAGKSISYLNMQKIKSAYEVLKELIDIESENNTNTDIESGGNEMKKEDIEQIVKSVLEDTIKPINKKLLEIEKEEEKNETIEMKKEDIEQIVKSILEDTIKPINERLTKVEISKGISKQISDESNKQELKKSLFSDIQI